jgi:antitoxin HigA-1
MRKVKPISAGELLSEEFLKPMGHSQYRLAKEIGAPPQRIGDIVLGKRTITAEVAERAIGPKLGRIKPWAMQLAQQRSAPDRPRPALAGSLRRSRASSGR